MEGRKGLPHHWKRYKHFRWSSRTSLRLLFCVVCSLSCPHKSANTEDHKSSQCYPPTRSKRAHFCWARCCWRAKGASWMTGCLEAGTALSPLSIHHLPRQQPLCRRRRHTNTWPQWAVSLAASACMPCSSDHQKYLWPPSKLPLHWTPGWLKATRWARRDDVLQNAKKNSTGSSPMTQEAQPHGATPLPCVLGYRAAACACNPVYARHVDSSPLGFSLSSHRHSYIGLVFSSRYIDP
jgi:hypothetical protein